MNRAAPVSCAVATLRAAAPACRCLLTVWSPRPGAFSARLVLDDGTLHDFDSPFELARFLAQPPPPTGTAEVGGLR